MKTVTPLLILCLLLFGSCTRTANKLSILPYPAITNDVDIGEEVRGQGTRAQLLGFIHWGDPGRASFDARPQESDLGGRVVKQSMQAAVYDALEGKPDHFIVDPHFHTVEHNFFVFKTATTSVVGRKAKNENYRQVKRFNTDNTETLLLQDAAQEVTIDRNGKESTKLTTSPFGSPDVIKSVKLHDVSDLSGKLSDFRVYEVSDSVSVAPSASSSASGFSGGSSSSAPSADARKAYQGKYDQIQNDLERNNRSYKTLQERLENLNRRLNSYSRSTRNPD